MLSVDCAKTSLKCESLWSVSERPIISISIRENLVAVSSEDGSVRVMRQDGWQEVACFDLEGLGEPTSVYLKNQATLFVSAGEAVHEFKFDILERKDRLNRPHRSWPVSTDEINSICALDHRRIAVADDSGTVSVLNLEQGVVKSFSPRLCHEQMCTSVTYQTKSGNLFSGGMDCKVKQWNIKTKSLMDEFDLNILRSSDPLATQFNPPYVNCLTSNDDFMFAGLGDGSIMVYRKSVRGRSVKEQHKFLIGHTLAVNALCLTADGKFLISGSNDKNCRLWSLDSMECISICHLQYKINAMTASTHTVLVGDVGGHLNELSW